MTQLVSLTAFTLSFVATLPAAACPTAADLEGGIEFRTGDGSVEIHRTTRPDWVTLHVTYSDGEISILDTYLGLYLQSTMPVVGGVPQVGASESFATAEELGQWDKPRPNAVWSNSTPGGGTAKSGPQRTITFGACSYDAIEVELTYNDDAGYTETYDYLTSLGTSILTKTSGDIGTDNYRYTSIKALN